MRDLLKWSNFSILFYTESLLGFLAIALTTTNAPVFQNVGADLSSVLEKKLVALFYGGLIVSSVLLFLGRLIYEYYCPSEIKKYKRCEDFQNALDKSGSTQKDVEDAEDNLSVIWDKLEERQSGKTLLLFIALAFIFIFGLSILSGILSLLVFAYC